MDFKKFIVENHPDPDSVFGIDKYDFEQIVVLAENFAKEQVKAINYTRCCTELNPEFEIGEQVLLTKRTVVTIETFCEDGMIEIDDNNEYYKVDKEDLTKRV